MWNLSRILRGINKIIIACACDFYTFDFEIVSLAH